MNWIRGLINRFKHYWFLKLVPIVEHTKERVSEVVSKKKKKFRLIPTMIWDGRLGPYKRRTPKRCVNAPCRCGSGIKYKRCCMLPR